jgi:hypothetical protein
MAQAYKYDGVPIMQAGGVEITEEEDGATTITFPIPFPDDGRLTF